MGRFREEKIIRTEEEAINTSSLYILPVDENTFRLIITDDNGEKKVNATLTGSANFTQLGDAPISYTNSAGKVVVVNSTESGLEFEELNSLSATIEVGTVTSVPSTQPPQITNVGTDKDAIFNFTIPVGIDGEPGQSATIQPGIVTSLNPEDSPTVTNVGTSSNAIFNFGIPKGEKGDSGELSVLNFNVDDDMHLIMELQTNTNLDFTLNNNGHLILTN